MSTNQATLYSNGIADFRRSYLVQPGQETRISIPVRTGHIGDVLASLNVYGAVTLAAPPSFRPANESAGDLVIDAHNVFESLATRLSGARVEVACGGSELAGALVGLHGEPQGTGGQAITPRQLVLMTAEGLRKVPLREVEKLHFSDPGVRAEIDKALQRNFESIKPGSTFVDLAVAADEETEAVIQYTIPAAAWKISYRLSSDAAGTFHLRGFAVVDNNTDEDWEGFSIAVVTGEPLTFSTDLAETKIPQRSHVNVVRRTALGAVEIEQAMFEAEDMEGMEPAAMSAAPMAKRSRGRPQAQAMEAFLEAAPMEAAEAEEVGDFSLFRSATPVTIAANRSAVIPMFESGLRASRMVLHFKSSNHPERPHRSIEFTNDTEHSLGRGVCTVYDEGVFVGSCVVPPTKPGGEALLAHALETGVRVRRQDQGTRSQVVGLRFSKGFCFTSTHEEIGTTYQVRNARDAAMPLILDHSFRIHGGTTQVRRRVDAGAEWEDCPVDASLDDGLRVRVELLPEATLHLRFDESRTSESRVQLVSDDSVHLDWLVGNSLVTDGPLGQDPQVQAVLDLQRQMDDKTAAIQRAESERQRLAERQERLRQNIQAVGHEEQSGRWRTDLAAAENRIVEIEDRAVPELQAELATLVQAARDAVLGLAVSWQP